MTTTQRNNKEILEEAQNRLDRLRLDSARGLVKGRNSGDFRIGINYSINVLQDLIWEIEKEAQND